MSEEVVKKRTYKAYISSVDWQKKRARHFINLRNRHCKACGTKENLNVHHRTYKRLEHEKKKDLVALCQNCHNDLHAMFGTSGLYNVTGAFAKVRKSRLLGHPMNAKTKGRLAFLSDYQKHPGVI